MMTSVLYASGPDGLIIAVPISSIEALVADDDLHGRTLVYVGDAVLVVAEPFEDLIDRLEAELAPLR